MSGFTPGPWRANGELFIKAANGWTVAQVRRPNSRGKEYFEGLPYAEANARLIAAAPELFAQLERAVELLDRVSDQDFYNVARVSREVLAKASDPALTKVIGDE